jgi:hypothetical protein
MSATYAPRQAHEVDCRWPPWSAKDPVTPFVTSGHRTPPLPISVIVGDSGKRQERPDGVRDGLAVG